ncbi:MAG: alpha/beta hydrolase [Planctomycetaceae bacterium]|jgi:pimeloyl-ACP methyl ester carboxylesterase|nr:alpha/beta hydrolase [Planctomycetaceae bacterium]
MKAISENLCYKTVTLADTKPSPIAFNLIDNGEDIPLLFIHGFPFNGSMWHRVANFLLNNSKPETNKSPDITTHQNNFLNYRTIIPDLRGLGKSKLTTLTTNSTKINTAIEQYADDLNAILNNIKVNKPITVIGLSMGGYIAVQFAHKYKNRVNSLVLCNTKTAPDTPEGKLVRQTLINDIDHSINPSNDILRNIADSMIPRLFASNTYSNKTDIVDEVRSMIESNNLIGIRAATWGMMTRHDTTDLLKEFDIPILVIGGEEDKFTPPDIMKQLAQTAKHGKYIEIANAGHLTPMEQPEQFAIALNIFVTEIITPIQ